MPTDPQLFLDTATLEEILQELKDRTYKFMFAYQIQDKEKPYFLDDIEYGNVTFPEALGLLQFGMLRVSKDTARFIDHCDAMGADDDTD